MNTDGGQQTRLTSSSAYNSRSCVEPLLAAEGPLAGSVGLIVGTGQGRGIGLLLISMGLLLILVTAISHLYPRLRLVEDELSDAVSNSQVYESGGSERLPNVARDDKNRAVYYTTM